MESLKLECHRFFNEKLGSIYYVINLGIQHYKIWKFYTQSSYLPLYTKLIFTLILNKIYELNLIPLVIHFLPVTIVEKQEELSIYF